ncbi:MAG: DUF1569 domain-containing protein [Acidobacteria bacterium]|nr:DUF1569 domain-containing protein [Acidobacteriota bacterium]
MPLPNAFDPSEIQSLVSRLGSLQVGSAPRWGRMDPAQMCAHCCTPYQQLRGEKGGGPLPLRLLARLFFKGSVVGEQPFKKNIPTPPAFRVADSRKLDSERERLVGFIREFHGQGAAAFEGRTHVTFGPLKAGEWSNLLWKHLDHHLRQFGV